MSAPAFPTALRASAAYTDLHLRSVSVDVVEKTVRTELVRELIREAEAKGHVRFWSDKGTDASMTRFHAELNVVPPAAPPTTERERLERWQAFRDAMVIRDAMAVAGVWPGRPDATPTWSTGFGRYRGDGADMLTIDDPRENAPADTPIDLMSDRKAQRVAKREAKEEAKEKVERDALSVARMGLAGQIAERARKLDQTPAPDPTGLLRQIDQFVLDLIPKILPGTSGKFALGVVAAEIKRLLDAAETQGAA